MSLADRLIITNLRSPVTASYVLPVKPTDRSFAVLCRKTFLKSFRIEL